MTTIHLSLHDVLLEHFGTSVEIPVTIRLDELLEHADGDEHDIDLAEHLQRSGNIAFLWHIDDVKQQRPDLNEEQCWEVLKNCRKHHDASIGMNWDVIDCVADMLFGTAPKGAGTEDGDV